jgi:hypothetical protein
MSMSTPTHGKDYRPSTHRIRPPSMALETITQRIFVLREQKVLLDADLAALYGVDTRRLNEQVRRNRDRFPQDFIFELTRDEYANLKSQFATSSLIAGNDEPASIWPSCMVWRPNGLTRRSNVMPRSFQLI